MGPFFFAFSPVVCDQAAKSNRAMTALPLPESGRVGKIAKFRRAELRDIENHHG